MMRHSKISQKDRPISSFCRFADQEEHVSNDNFQELEQVHIQEQSQVQSQEEAPGYTFLGEQTADVFRELADMHHREAKQLLERANASEAEGREEEAKLLLDVSLTREQRARELEMAARGEAEDPSVIEVLDGQEDILKTYAPNTMTFFKEDELPPATVPEHMRPVPPGRIAKAMAKVSNWWNQ
jgi:hypothetical protein